MVAATLRVRIEYARCPAWITSSGHTGGQHPSWFAVANFGFLCCTPRTQDFFPTMEIKPSSACVNRRCVETQQAYQVGSAATGVNPSHLPPFIPRLRRNTLPS